MKEKVFFDTGFWIALFDKRDDEHSTARTGLKSILEGCRAYLSDFIIFETITYLNCSIKRHDLAMRFLSNLHKSTITTLVVNESLKSEALEWFEKYSDKDLSFTDCTSFVLMTQSRIYKYAGFDEHFNQMGFSSALMQ